VNPFAISAGFLLLASAGAACAQDAPAPASIEQENDGTDPTSPAKFAKVSFEHLDLALPDGLSGDNSNSFIFEYQQPFGNNAIKFKLPVVSVDALGNSAYSIGDVSAKLTHVLSAKKTHGIVLNGEIVFNTASRPELGTGKTVIKPGITYAFFLKGGHIFAPAFVQSLSIAGDDNRADISSSTIDFYFVPKLANPKLFMTLDPAITHDWENDKTFVVTALTLGFKLGPMLGGKGQMFIKPSIGFGSDRPTGWGISTGFQLLSF
jgi:hypothetical protein